MTNGRAKRWLSVVASVEWRSERRHAQRPAAILAGGERVSVVEEVHWVEGPAVAGERLATIFEVEAEDGHHYRITVREDLPDRVERAEDF